MTYFIIYCNFINCFSLLIFYQLDCKLKNSHITMIVDTSGIVGSENFKISKKFMKNAVTGLKIEQHNNAVSVIQYSSSVKREFSLNEYDTEVTLRDAIDNIPHTAGTERYTARAIRESNSVFKDEKLPNDDSSRIVIVITDGKATESSVELIQDSDKLRNELSAVIVVIGIGNDINSNELKGMANTPLDKYYFHINTYEELENISNNILNEVCKVVPIIIPESKPPTMLYVAGAAAGLIGLAAIAAGAYFLSQ